MLMKHSIIFTLLTTLALAVHSSAQEHSAMDQAVGTEMKSFIDQQQIAGAVTLVADSRGVIHHQAIGMASIENEQAMRTDSLFRIASLTKNFVAASLMTLQDQGKLNINDLVATHLPEFEGIGLKKDDGKGPVDLRIWHLLSHTSGVNYPKYTAIPPLKTASVGMAKLDLNFRPGSQWKYSKGMAVVARIVEVASGMTFEAYVEKSLYAPLGLTDTGFGLTEAQGKRLATTYEPGPNKTIIPASSSYFATPPGKATLPRPSGGLISSANDLHTFYAMLLNQGMHDGKQVLSKQSVELLLKSRTDGMNAGFVPGSAYGLGFGLVKEPQGVTAMLNPGTFGHGGGSGAQAWVDPLSKRVYILLIQRTKFGNSDASEVRKKFQQAAADQAR